MKRIATILALAAASFASCNKPDTGQVTSPCIDQKIIEYSSMAPCNDAWVDEYIFRGSTVYVFQPGTCGADMTAAVLDANCYHLGDLGGFSGNTIINGEDFNSATFVRTVWSK